MSGKTIYHRKAKDGIIYYDDSGWNDSKPNLMENQSLPSNQEILSDSKSI